MERLQLRLKAAGFDPGDIDGIFGKATRAALEHFQTSYEKLATTGVLDEETDQALDQALVIRQQLGDAGDGDGDGSPAAVVPCSPATWAEVLGLVKLVTSAPVGYGPGRGLYANGTFVVTFGPGALGSKTWPTHLPKTHPSFHCTSWANFFLGWLLRYNAEYTHAGNVPSLFTLLESSRDLHQQAGAGVFRGYGPYAKEILTDGQTMARVKIPKVIDIYELHARRASLPSFLVAGQSTKMSSGWKWWHHVVVFAVDHHAPGTPLYRIAADGYRDANGYSGNPMRWVEINASSFGQFAAAIYRVYGIQDPDDVAGGPRAPFELER